MSERTRTLHETMAALERQLARAERLDPELRDELRSALADLRAHVDAGSEAEPPLLARIRTLTLHFEAAHPALADAVGAVATALARIGI